MKKNYVCQEDNDQNMACVADHLVRDASRIGSLFTKSSHLSFELPVKKSFLSAVQADLSCTPLFHNALCLDVVIPGVFRAPIEVVVIVGKSTAEIIYDV